MVARKENIEGETMEGEVDVLKCGSGKGPEPTPGSLPIGAGEGWEAILLTV